MLFSVVCEQLYKKGNYNCFNDFLLAFYNEKSIVVDFSIENFPVNIEYTDWHDVNCEIL